MNEGRGKESEEKIQTQYMVKERYYLCLRKILNFMKERATRQEEN